MNRIAIQTLIIPNAYINHLAQEFSDWARLTAGTGLPATQLDHYDGPITVAQALQCVRNAMAMATQPDWYLNWSKRMAEHFHGPVTVAWLSAPTLGDGLDVFLKYMPSRVPYFHWQGHREGELFYCELSELMDLGSCRALLIELPILVMHEYVNTIRAGTLDRALVELKYSATPHASLYSNWFRCPVVFDAPRNALVIPWAWRAVRNAGYDEGTWQAALRRLDATCASIKERDTLTQVRQTVFDLLEHSARTGAPPSLEDLAARIHVSPRTLIRRLRSLGTTYQEVTDEVQKCRARELLANETLKIHEVAARLGYQDPTSFGRSFKRWFGVTPGDFRKQLVIRGARI